VTVGGGEHVEVRLVPVAPVWIEVGEYGFRAWVPAGVRRFHGNQALDSLSAQASADQQVRKALEISDLTREAGLSAG
jgi:hypothetical protein